MTKTHHKKTYKFKNLLKFQDVAILKMWNRFSKVIEGPLLNQQKPKSQNQHGSDKKYNGVTRAESII